jgi:uncharacterized protein (TIGR03435 family)
MSVPVAFRLNSAMKVARVAIPAVALTVGIMGGPALWAQGVRVPELKFEVASVKPSTFQAAAFVAPGERGNGGGCPLRLKIDSARVDFECSTLRMLIGYAYHLSPDRVTGPNWMMGVGSPRFDISAKLPQGAPKDHVPEMVQALLAERFKLTTHRATAIGDVYALVVAKGGQKLKQAVDAPSPVSADADALPGATDFFGELQTHTAPNADGTGTTTTISNPRMGTVREMGNPRRIQRWEAPSTSLGGLADLLDNVAPLPSPIIDMTGLKGRYQVILEVSSELFIGVDPDEMEHLTLQAFNNGLQKLGLRLEHQKASLETIVVDHIEKTPTDN